VDGQPVRAVGRVAGPDPHVYASPPRSRGGRADHRRRRPGRGRGLRLGGIGHARGRGGGLGARPGLRDSDRRFFVPARRGRDRYPRHRSAPRGDAPNPARHGADRGQRPRRPIGTHAGPATTLRWLDLPEGAAPGTAMVEAIESLGAMPAVVWVAGEAAAMQRIRTHLFDGRGLTRSQATVRGYWKLGRSAT